MLKAVVYIGGHLPHVPTPLPKHLFKKEVKLRRPGKKKNFGEKYNRSELSKNLYNALVNRQWTIT